MIIVKTNLKKIPENCSKCKFSYVDSWSRDRICSIASKTLEMIKVKSGNKAYVRPDTCPLIIVDNILESVKENDDD